MSQLQEVVRCYSCETFQVQIQKKAKNKRWICKVCNEKQSLKKVYFTGLGAECRNVVKEFNMKRGQISDLKSSAILSLSEEEYDDHNEELEDENQDSNEHENPAKKSKWTAYMSNEEIQETERAFKQKSANSLQENEANLEDGENGQNHFTVENKDNYENYNPDFEEDFDHETYLDDFTNNQNKRSYHKKQSTMNSGSKWNKFGGDLSNSSRLEEESAKPTKRSFEANPTRVNKTKQSKWSSYLPPPSVQSQYPETSNAGSWNNDFGQLQSKKDSLGTKVSNRKAESTGAGRIGSQAPAPKPSEETDFTRKFLVPRR